MSNYKQKKESSSQRPSNYKAVYYRQLQNPQNLISKILRLIKHQRSIKYYDLKKICIEKGWSNTLKSGHVSNSIIVLREANLIEDIGRGSRRILKIKLTQV